MSAGCNPTCTRPIPAHSTTALAIDPSPARQWMRLFSITKRFCIGSMPSDRRQLRSFGSTWREISAISARPVSRTTLGPISIWTPRPIGPLLRKRPFEIVLTVPVTASGRLSPGIAGIAILPPIASATSAADPGRDRLLNGLRVVDREGGDVFEPLAQDRGEHGGRVHRAARGAVVVMIEQDDRPLAGLRRLQRLGARQRLFERFELVDEILAVGPGPVEQFVAQSFGERAVAVGHDDRRQPGIGDVGVREAGEQAGGERALGLCSSRRRGPAIPCSDDRPNPAA